MKIRKLVAILATATLAFWTPSIVPVGATGGCGFTQYQTVDTAYANPGRPCLPQPHSGSPWPAVAILIGTSSVIINAIYIWHEQCRELSSQEAMTSAFLPLIGIAFDAQASKCHP
jgi:hypothetical protein